MFNNLLHKEGSIQLHATINKFSGFELKILSILSMKNNFTVDVQFRFFFLIESFQSGQTANDSSC